MIRNAEERDMSFVYDCLCALEECTLDKQAFKTGFALQLADSSLSMHVLEQGDKRCGYMSCRVVYHLHHCAYIAMVEELYVCPDARGSGKGRALLEYARQGAKQQGCIQLELSSDLRRTSAHAFYKRMKMSCKHYKFTWNL